MLFSLVGFKGNLALLDKKNKNHRGLKQMEVVVGRVWPPQGNARPVSRRDFSWESSI